MSSDSTDARIARIDERTKNILSVVQKLPCIDHAQRIARVETKATLLGTLGGLFAAFALRLFWR